VAAVWLAAGAIVYSPQYVVRVLAWGESDIGDYLNGFPSRRLRASPTPFEFTLEPAEDVVRAAFESALDVADFDAFLAGAGTQAFIVIKGDRIVYEQYFNGSERGSMLTSFSVAKSFVSTLVGIAIDEGHIAVDDPITDYLPELLERDEAFRRITIRDLLLMAGGLDFQELRWWLFNGDDPLTTYYPDQREISLNNTHIVDPPGGYFLYNKYHPQLLGMILERATDVSVTEFTQTRLWDPLGMEYDGAWALDSTNSGFEKMEAGLNARAIDYAKLGRLILNDGNWDGTRVISADWVAESTSLDPATHTPSYYAASFGPDIYNGGSGYYKYMWYGKLRGDGPPDIAAEGDHGQIIYISPANDVIIVRNGTRFGIPLSEWTDAFYRVAGDL
jgi:CubicO group peptidase (beta-lactamase class C family)